MVPNFSSFRDNELQSRRGLRPRLIPSPPNPENLCYNLNPKTIYSSQITFCIVFSPQNKFLMLFYKLFIPNYIFHCFFPPKQIFNAFLQIIPPKLHFSLFFQYKIEFSCFFHFFSIFRYYISKSRWDPIARLVVPHPKPSICRTSGHVVIFSDPQNAYFAYILTKNEKKVNAPQFFIIYFAYIVTKNEKKVHFSLFFPPKTNF